MLICFDGLDGCGKSSLIESLRGYFIDNYYVRIV